MVVLVVWVEVDARVRDFMFWIAGVVFGFGATRRRGRRDCEREMVVVGRGGVLMAREGRRGRRRGIVARLWWEVRVKSGWMELKVGYEKAWRR